MSRTILTHEMGNFGYPRKVQRTCLCILIDVFLICSSYVCIIGSGLLPRATIFYLPNFVSNMILTNLLADMNIYVESHAPNRFPPPRSSAQSYFGSQHGFPNFTYIVEKPTFFVTFSFLSRLGSSDIFSLENSF